MDIDDFFPEPHFVDKTTMRTYHRGDTFYISEGAAREANIPPQDRLETDQPLVPGTVVIIYETPTTSNPVHNASVKTIGPDGTEMPRNMAALISIEVLNTLPPDRRYGRKLTALGMRRPKEIAGFVQPGMESKEVRFRRTDSDEKIEKLRAESGFAIWGPKTH
jgi:hypothetical protein